MNFLAKLFAGNEIKELEEGLRELSHELSTAKNSIQFLKSENEKANEEVKRLEKIIKDCELDIEYKVSSFNCFKNKAIEEIKNQEKLIKELKEKANKEALKEHSKEVKEALKDISLQDIEQVKNKLRKGKK